jgi:hypothetical protein
VQIGAAPTTGQGGGWESESRPAFNTGLLPAFLLRCGYGAQNPWMGPKTIVVCLWIMRLALSLALAILVLAPSYAAGGAAQSEERSAARPELSRFAFRQITAHIANGFKLPNCP